MSAVRTCPRCGTELRRDALEGLCTDCLGKMVSGSRDALNVQLSTSNVESSERRFGDYELIEKIAHGGMGVVYKARQLSLNRTVAVKMIRAGVFASKEFVHRFRVEASAAAVLQHPNIVAVHEVGVHEGQHFFSMDYVAGKNLAQIVRDGPLPPPRAARYVQKIAEAIHYAHQSGILHRDLKPSNVLIDQNDQPRITDFGLAKQLNSESSATLTGEVMGTPGYMPPEQASGNRGAVMAWSDVYSIGAILYHLLTGRPPFAAGSLEETLNQVLHKDPVSIRVLNSAVQRDLDTICLKCLEKEPGKRYCSALSLADELTRFLNHEPILARPTSAAGKAWRWCKRKPVVASLTGLALLLFASGFAGILWQWRRAEKGELAARQTAYASDMNLVPQAIKVSNLGRARELLNRNRPKAGELDLRHWEWHFLWQRCQSSALFSLSRGPEGIGSVAFSADGRWFAAKDGRGLVSLWNLGTTQEVARWEDRWFRRSSHRAMTFAPESSILLSGGCNPHGQPVVFIRDVVTKMVLGELHHSGELMSLAISPGSKLLATFSTDQSVVVWNLKSQMLVTNFPASPEKGDHRGVVRFSPDGSLLAVGETDGRIRLLNTTGWKERSVLNGPAEGITALAFSPDGGVLAAGSGYSESAIKRWHIASGRSLPDLIGHEAFITCLEFAPDGKTLASSAADQTIRLWDFADGKEITSLRGHANEVFCVTYAPDGQMLVSGSKDGEVLFWKPAPTRTTEGFKTLPVRARAYALSPNGQIVAVVTTNGSVSLWDSIKGAESVRPVGLGTNSSDISFTLDGAHLVVTDVKSHITVWDIRNERVQGRLVFQSSSLIASDLLSDNRQIAFMDDTRTIRIWDFIRGRTNAAWHLGLTEPLNIISISSGVMLTRHASGIGKLWDIQTGRVLTDIPRVNERTEPMLTPQRLKTGAACAPDRSFLVTGNESGVAISWDVRTGRELATLRGHLLGIHSLAISPDGRRLATGSGGREAIKLWDTATWQEVATLAGEGSMFEVASFSSDGSTIAAMNSDGIVHIWHAPTFPEILTAETTKRSKRHIE